MVGKRLLDVGKTFLAVALAMAGLFSAGGAVLLSVLGGDAPTAHYLFIGTAFITLAVLLFRWHPKTP